MSKKEVKILLISDIHFDSVEQDSIHKGLSGAVYSFRALIDFFNEYSEKIDYVVINGDIANKNVKDDFILAKKYFLELLSLKEKLPKIDKWIFSCGNHDLSRKELLNSLKDDLFDKETKKNKVENRNDFLKKDKIHYFENAFKYYIEFLKDLGIDKPPYENDFIKSEEDDEKMGWLKYLCGKKTFYEDFLEFSVYNSSWYCKDDDDMGNLLLGKDLISFNKDEGGNVIKKDNFINVSCVHHGNNWYHWTENHLGLGEFSNNLHYIEEYSDIILTGHQHTPIPLHPTQLHSRTLVVEGGALYEDVDYPNSFKIINLNIGDKTLTIDNYIPTKRQLGYNWNANHYDKKVYNLNTSFDDRVTNEDAFWKKNKKISFDKKKTRKYLTDKFTQDFNVKLKSKESYGENVFYYEKTLIYYIPMRNEKQCRDKISSLSKLYKNKFDVIIIYPVFLIKDKSIFELTEDEIDGVYSEFSDKIIILKNLKSRYLNNEHIDLQNALFYTNKEVSDGEESKTIRQKIKKQLELIS